MTINDFWIAGVSYKKTDATNRGRFSVSDEQYAKILRKAGQCGIKNVFILSTCNRTEIYALTDKFHVLTDIFCAETKISRGDFDEHCYTKNSENAVSHLFHVSAGLDSQVLGDYEIVGQIKRAISFAREEGFIGPHLQRLINVALQSSKAVKNATGLSGGTVSVSFTAIQYIREYVANYKDKKILLLGVGKIGRSTCKNLVDYLDNRNIILTNRTPEKAKLLADQMGLNHAVLEDLASSVREADIIIACTNSLQPIITKDLVSGNSPKLIIDIAIPYNVDPAVGQMENISLLNVDQLSAIKDETLQRRTAEIPKAKAIIEKHISDYMLWLESRRHAVHATHAAQRTKEAGLRHTAGRQLSEPQVVFSEVKMQEAIRA